MTAPGGFIAGDVLGAADMNGLPGGVVGYARVTADQGPFTTETDLTSLTATWTATSSRLYKYTFHCVMQNNDTALSASEAITVKVTDGSNVMVLQAVQYGPVQQVGGTLGQLTFVGVGYQTGLSGSTTRKLRALSTTSGATLLASSTSPAFFIVEDIGPA